MQVFMNVQGQITRCMATALCNPVNVNGIPEM